MKVGFIGLGNMGGAIARRIQRAHELCVFDLNAGAVEGFVRAGAAAADSPRGVAASCEIVLTCLPTSNDVNTVIFGDDGLAGALGPGALIADMTTGDPTMTRAMAESLAARDIALIDAPVSGGPQGADKGTLAIMVGAPDAQFERIKGVLEAVSPNIFHVGGVGNGHTMKLVNNVVSASIRAITFEAVALGVKNGLDVATCIDVMQKSSGRSFATETTFPNFILTGTLNQGFSLGLMHKDVSLATKLGQDSATPMMMAGLVREIYQTALNDHGGDVDINHLIRHYEKLAGVKVVPS